MDLKQFIKERKEVLTIWHEFEGVPFEIEYTDKATLQAMIEKSKDVGFNPKTHQREDILSDDKFNKQLADRVKGWKLTLADLVRLTNIRLNGDDPTQDVPCHPDNVATLIGEAYGLSRWLLDTIKDLSEFDDARRQADLKNLETTPG